MIISQLVMLFGLETVEIMAVAALRQKFQRPFNIRPALFMIRRIFPLCNCPLNLKRVRFILAPRDSDNDFRIFQLSSTLSRLDPTLYNKCSRTLPLLEEPYHSIGYKKRILFRFREFFFLLREGKIIKR